MSYPSLFRFVAGALAMMASAILFEGSARAGQFPWEMPSYGGARRGDWAQTDPNQAAPAKQEGEASERSELQGDRQPETAAAVANAATLTATKPSPAPFYRGWTVAYRNVMSAISVDRHAWQSWDPYYGMQLAIQPRFQLSKRFYARGSFDVATELTKADWTNDRFFLSDIGLGLGGDGLYAIPTVGVEVSGGIGASIPTSKGSRAASRILATSGGVSLSRHFGILTIGYAAGVEKLFNSSTTPSPTAYLVGSCGLSNPSSCMEMIIQNGRRNASWGLTNSLSASVDVKPWLTLSIGGGFSTAFLYALEVPPAQVSAPVENPPNTRYFLSTNAAASVKASEMVTAVLGISSSHDQLAPGGGYYAPLLNRFTQVTLDLRLSVESLMSKLKM